jgi:L-alanine-DL-glutamate epimerase-like enolase superfamily enzyme
MATPMRIESIDVCAVLVPLTTPTAFSTRELKGREYVIVRVVDDSGASGVGYTYAGDAGGLWLQIGVEQLLAPRLYGHSIYALEESWERIFRDLLLLGRRGALLRALSAVDIALWDLVAKKAGLPLRYALGGTEDTVAAYASGGYYRPGDPFENVVGELERYRELGFTDFKLKFGGLPLEEDLERVATARRTLGADARLALDVNNGWQSFRQALDAIEALRRFDIWWIEEPFAPDDIDNHVLLTAHSPIPIATGELESTRWGFAQLVDRGAAHILQPDACVAGGIGEWWRIAALAAEEGIPIVPHWHANLHAQLAVATPNCTMVEYFAPGEGIYNFEQLVTNPLSVEDGRITLDQTAGIGVELDWDVVDQHTIGEATPPSGRTDTNGRRPSSADVGGSTVQHADSLPETRLAATRAATDPLEE